MTHRSLRCDKRSTRPLSLLGAILALAIAAPVGAQTAPASPQSFEVASIRAVGADHGFTVFPKFPAAQFTAENMSMTLLISFAYGISDNRISHKPDWLDSTLFTVRAKPEGDSALTAKQYQPLLQQLLQKRFKLSVHHETKDLAGYALVIAKGGQKLTPSKDKGTDAALYILPEGLRCTSISTKTLAGLLSRPLGQPVIDKTGMDGKYDLNLTYAPATLTESTLPSIFTALQEQLGLKLEPQKVPTDLLIIDHVEKVPTEN